MNTDGTYLSLTLSFHKEEQYLPKKREILCIYLLERGERRETSTCESYMDLLPLAHPQLGTWPASQACALTGNLTGDPLLFRLALDPLIHTSKD